MGMAGRGGMPCPANVETMRTPTWATLAALGVILPAVVLAQAPKSSAPAGAPSAGPEASPNDIDGEQMFATSCGFCHQQGGRAAGRGPKLAGMTKSDEFIIERIKKGKAGTMPAYARAFSEAQIIAILAYIRGLEDTGG
jgi:mono/diheme cytochrome c family protein